MNEKLNQQIEKENQLRSIWNTIMNSEEDTEVELNVTKEEFMSFIERMEN